VTETTVFENGLGKVVPKDKLSHQEQYVVEQMRTLMAKILNHDVFIETVYNPQETSAAFGDFYLILNIAALPKDFWFMQETFLWYIAHEASHSVSGDHESREFSDANCRFGAKLTLLALREPHLFIPFPFTQPS
jgi:hypothetical protein